MKKTLSSYPYWKFCFLVIVVFIFIAGCADQPASLVGEATIPSPGGWPTSTPEELLLSYVIPAAESTEPLPDNPEGVSALQSQIEVLAEP